MSTLYSFIRHRQRGKTLRHVHVPQFFAGYSNIYFYAQYLACRVVQGRLSTADLLKNVTRFVTNDYSVFIIKLSRSKLVSKVRSTSLCLPLQ